VSFIIPAKNEEKVIAQTIQRCFEVEYPKRKLEVIVINDGSTDGTWHEIKKMKKKYPRLIAVNWKKNRGKRRGMAEGFRRAIGDIVIQLDSDSFIERNSLRKLIEGFLDPRVAAITAHTDPVNKEENWITKMQVPYYFMSFRILKAAESAFDAVFCCSGCCSAYRRSYVMPVLNEWLNERFLDKPIIYGDDRALTNLMLKNGYKTIYSEKAQAFTIVPNTLKKFLKQQIRWKKGWFINSVKASKFIIKRDWFVAFTYFLPLIFFTLVSPFINVRALFVNPFLFGIYPFFYIGGVMLIAALFALHYKAHRNDGYWKYMFVWSFLNIFILSYVLLYAVATLRNNKWGTR
jgi:hyaluronan synthase